MKLTDVLVSAIIKKGVLYEARNVEVDIPVTKMDIPVGVINVKCDHMSLRFERDAESNTDHEITR